MRDDAVSIIVCGAGAAALLPAYVMQLRRQVQHPVRLLLTRSAERFLRPEAVAWFADETYGSWSELNPTELAQRSRAVIVLPATANMLAAAALGLAGSPAQTAVLATAGPVLFLPSMSRTMWERASTRGHVAALRADGHRVVDPVEGSVYELWHREVVQAPALAGPVEVAAIVADWLESTVAHGPDDLLPATDHATELPWSQFNVEVEHPVPDLYRRLGELGEEVLADRTVTDLFYVHKAPGLRLRYRIGDADAARTRIRLAARLGDLRDAGLLAGWRPAVYEPEQRLFGGPVSMRSVHRLFTADSRVWLSFHGDATGGHQRPIVTWALSLCMIRSLLDALGVLGWEDVDVWDRLGRDLGRLVAGDVAKDARVSRIADVVRAGWADPDSLRQHVPGSVDAPLERYREAVTAEAARWIRDYFTQPGAVIGPRQAAALAVIFHWNRGRLPMHHQALLTSVLAARLEGASS